MWPATFTFYRKKKTMRRKQKGRKKGRQIVMYLKIRKQKVIDTLPMI